MMTHFQFTLCQTLCCATEVKQPDFAGCLIIIDNAGGISRGRSMTASLYIHASLCTEVIRLCTDEPLKIKLQVTCPTITSSLKFVCSFVLFCARARKHRAPTRLTKDVKNTSFMSVSNPAYKISPLTPPKFFHSLHSYLEFGA